MQYSIVLEPLEEGGFLVRIPTLGIATQADTEEQSVEMATDAIEGYIACLIADGETVPLEEKPSITKLIKITVPAHS